MKTSRTRLIAAALCLALAAGLPPALCLRADASAPVAPDDSAVFLKQSPNTCTLYSVLMMFRRGAILNGNENWDCFTEANYRSAWWIEGVGIRASLSGEGMRAEKETLDAALASLVDKEHDLVRLFVPPFTDSERSPGYISSYGPGGRENGGQYTHGAVWLALALAERGRREEAAHILRMLLPTAHDALRYEAEPFVLAADVSDAPGFEERAGWTWYTGSAGWYLRAARKCFPPLPKSD